MRKIDIAAAALLFVGAVNWGFIGLFNINAIHFFVENELVDRFVYTMVGVAAIYRAIYWKAIRSRWKDE